MTTETQLPIRAYACGLRGSREETIVNHVSRGKAKSEFLLDMDMDEVRFTDITCRVVGPPMATENFQRMAFGRGIEFAKPGMKVKVGDHFGRIVGYNASDNLDVLFDHNGRVLNCHPKWMITYYDDDDNVIREFKPEPRETVHPIQCSHWKDGNL